MKAHKFMKICLFKSLNLGRVFNFSKRNCHDQHLQTRSKLHQQRDQSAPRDVPRGHLAVYVGEDCKRYVIKLSVLKHRLFKPLLDLTEEVFGFATASSKLRIPCNESVFVSVLNYVRCQQDRSMLMCCF